MKATINPTDLAESMRTLVMEIGEITPDVYHLNASFKSDFGLDSLDMVELIMICEKDYTIHLPDHEWTHLDSPGELLSLIQKKMRG